MTEEKRKRFIEWSNDTAVSYVERLINVWVAKGLPLGVLARVMIGMGASIIEAGEGHEAAFVAIETISAQLAENSPPPPSLN